MVNQLFKTKFGEYSLSFKSGSPMIVFLSGADSFSTAQTFAPIIRSLPKQAGFLTIDYLFSGFSSPARGDYNYQDSLDDIEKIISTKTTGSIIIVAHSIGGVYALELFHRFTHITAFVGIEPTTREIINNPPKTKVYIDVSKKYDAMGQDGFTQYIHKKLVLCFPSQQADLIWQTAENSEKSASKFATQYKNFSDSFDWHSHARLSGIPSVIFTEKYRKEEYLRSEFMTDNQYSKVISLGDFHYIHWEDPVSIAEGIKEVIKNLI